MALVPTKVEFALTPRDGVMDSAASGAVDMEADWSARSTASGVIVAENFSDYVSRGAWLAALQAAGEDVQYTHTLAAFDGDDRWDDPVPEGAVEKLLLSTEALSGQWSAYHRILLSEGASERGPLFSLSFMPASRWYCQFAIRWEPGAIGHEYAIGGGKKILFLNQLSFTGGQIVLTVRDDSPWLGAYRVTSEAEYFLSYVTDGPGSKRGDRQYLPAWDDGAQSESGQTDATNEQLWERRYGPSYRNHDPDDADFAAMPVLQADTWYVVETYVDQDWVGAESRGLFKMWLAEYGDTPRLIICHTSNAGLVPYDELQMSSIRPVWRPEDAPAGQTEEGGVMFAELIVSSEPIAYPGGIALPYPGREVPPWYPPANREER